ncbi:MAG: hypothetical protein AAF663_00180 [Planctomycetota bacterium]
MDIASALFDEVQRYADVSLVIKAHPFDYGELYQSMIAERNLSGRVTLSVDSVEQEIKSAGVVLTEDSTVGLEAMIFGRPVIHTHFATSPPAIDFADAGAARRAFDPKMLSEALATTCRTDHVDARMHEAQRKLLDRHLGSLDGNAGQRVRDLVCELMNSPRVE